MNCVPTVLYSTVGTVQYNAAYSAALISLRIQIVMHLKALNKYFWDIAT